MKTISRFLFFAILLFFNSAFADIASDAENLFNWGEQKYPKYFTTGETKIVTQVLDSRGYKWYYRYYPQTKIYLVTNKLYKVYVLGGVFGDNLLYVGTIQELLNQNSDVTPPIITLSGNNPVTVNQGSNYTDAGATATDDVDGSVEVTTTGSVDTSKVGTYTITYTATDKAGNTATATRTVNVVEEKIIVVINPSYKVKKNHILDIDYKSEINTTASLYSNPSNGSVEITEIKKYKIPKGSINDSTSFSEYNNSYLEQDIDLVIVGLYEASSTHKDSNGNRIVGETEVNIKNGGDKPITLVLSSYEPVLWKISVEDGVNINKVILNGYYEQSFSGIDSSLVENKKLYSCGYSLPYNGGGCDTNKLIEKVEEFTNLKLTKFIGSYRSNDISITTSDGSIVSKSSKITYTPHPDYIGNDSFDVQFTNNELQTVEKKINIEVIEPKTLASKTSKNFINGKYIVDLDSDGDLDVLDTSKWNENDGNDNFITHELPFKASLVFAADMDNDGDIDIVSRYGTEIILYKNNGYQKFSKFTTINRSSGFGYDSNGIYLADMDSDGDMDIIAAWFGQDWYENNGDGNFTKHSMNGTGKDIIAEDVDSDGDMDYIESDNNVIWHENNGNQSFTSHRLSAKDIGGASSYAIDIDKDGDMDIISTRRWTQGIELYENDGNQNFTTIIVSNNKYSSYTYATDIDKDGYIDILNGTTWFKNDGNNNFTKQPSITLDNARLITLVNSEAETDKIIHNEIIHNGVNYGTVTSPYTSRIWLDRNLGASRVCQSFDDEQCYGDYYQWGRLNDGHQFSTSEISSTSASNITNAGTDFIIAQEVNPELAGYDMDWVSIPDEDPEHIAELRKINWSKIDGTGICPVGYRVPTVEELKNEINVEFLKLPLAGYRSGYNGDISFQGREWKIWSSSVEEQGPGSQILMFDKDAPSENLKIAFTIRSDGLSIRCIKD